MEEEIINNHEENEALIINEDDFLSKVEKAAEKGAKKGGRGRGIVTILCVIVLGYALFSILGSVSDFSEKLSDISSFDSGISEHDYAIEDNGIFGYTAADFEDAVLGESQKEKKIVVYSQTVSDVVTASQTGLFKWAVFSKCQYITYHGTVDYTVDLSQLNSSSISFDKENCVVTLKIPHPEQGDINIPSDQMEFGDVDKGLLSFGEIKMSVEDSAKLETEAKKKMEEIIAEENVQEDADRFAKLVVWELYSPIIKSVGKNCSLEVEFAD